MKRNKNVFLADFLIELTIFFIAGIKGQKLNTTIEMNDHTHS